MEEHQKSLDRVKAQLASLSDDLWRAGEREWAAKLVWDIASGATGGEIAMALRMHLATLLRSDEAQRLGLEPRIAKLLVDMRDNSIVLLPEPHDYARHLRGRHREVWEGIDPQNYVVSERETWLGRLTGETFAQMKVSSRTEYQ
jgi:hypothetical protein